MFSALYSTCVKSEQDSDFILESSLITASAKFTTNIFENSIDINQFGTFLLHLPSSITYEYATYTNEEETMFSTPTQNNANLTTLKTSTALQTNKSTATVTNPYRTRITLSDIIDCTISITSKIASTGVRPAIKTFLSGKSDDEIIEQVVSSINLENGLHISYKNKYR
ncbi:hypothetical protein RI543_003740 [Arxiozyma heterogenica]|uniref:Uncharacterized protein n=1 Tax=Arxiozyma heterogenica TaxID=278026 RepID=A0AAN7ZXE1_9SACH|nr:hypothetical protein RI543_003740 [Kazachstania heterogenica]